MGIWVRFSLEDWEGASMSMSQMELEEDGVSLFYGFRGLGFPPCIGFGDEG